jgi:hypothetical protein
MPSAAQAPKAVVPTRITSCSTETEGPLIHHNNGDINTIAQPANSSHQRSSSIEISSSIGIDCQLLDSDNYGVPNYLNGRFSASGWWYYYLYGLAIKEPCGFWMLCVLAAVSLFASSCAQAHADCALLIPAGAFLVVLSAVTTFNHHLRYVMPALPFLFVFSSRAVQLADKWRLGRLAVALALAWTITSSLQCIPHSLSYFNECVGGPECGPFRMLESNSDWGQDLFCLARWAKAHPDRPE